MVDAKVGQSVDHGVLNGGHRPDRPGLSDAFHAEGVHLGGRLLDDPFEGRKLDSRHDAIVHEVRRQRCPVVGVSELLHERLGHASGDSAVDLPVDDHRVHDDAGVVTGHVAQDADLAGLAVHLDDAGVHPERKRRLRGLEINLFGELDRKSVV